MSDHSRNSIDGFTFRFFSARQVDEILRAGAKGGREGSSAAIKRILRVEPAIERAELWKRLRQLKFPPCPKPYCRSKWTEEDDRILRSGYANGRWRKRDAVRELLRRHPDWRPHTIWKRAAKLRLITKHVSRGQERSRLPWNEGDNQVLLNLAGYKTSRAIARILHRSEAAIRCHLMVLGKSSRAYRDGFSRHELAAQLHIGRNTIQRLIVDGLLQVRDPRITRDSLEALKHSGHLSALCLRGAGTVSHCAEAIPTCAVGPCGLRSGNKSRSERVWTEVANLTGLHISTIKRLIVQRALKFYDPTVTEKSVRDLCRHHGALINYDLLSRETQVWLRDSMDLDRTAGEAPAPHLKCLRQHARITRRCEKCGRSIRGNVFFKHVKNCASKGATTGLEHIIA